MLLDKRSHIFDDAQGGLLRVELLGLFEARLGRHKGVLLASVEILLNSLHEVPQLVLDLVRVLKLILLCIGRDLVQQNFEEPADLLSVLLPMF